MPSHLNLRGLCARLCRISVFSQRAGAVCGDFLHFSETTGPSWRVAAPRLLGSAVPQGICSSDLPRGRACGSGEGDCPGWQCFSCGDRSPDRAVRRGLHGRWHFLGTERLPVAMSPGPVWCEHINVTSEGTRLHWEQSLGDILRPLFPGCWRTVLMSESV